MRSYPYLLYIEELGQKLSFDIANLVKNCSELDISPQGSCAANFKHVFEYYLYYDISEYVNWTTEQKPSSFSRTWFSKRTKWKV